MANTIELIGDGIENPWNAKTMIDIAKTFGSACYFRDRKGLFDSYLELPDFELSSIQLIACEQVMERFSPVLALENVEAAADIYGFKVAAGMRAALIVGNERYGISHDMHQTSTHVLQIPMPGRTLNTLNVATAAGVALYYLCTGNGGRIQVRSEPQKRRPEIYLIGGTDHIELGSTIRSASAFGWERAFVEDRHAVWFGCDRVKRSEGRAAARRGRNSIRLAPADRNNKYAFKEAVVISNSVGTPFSKASLAMGPQKAIILPDESSVDVHREDWSRFGSKVQFVRIDVPASDFVYRYRLFASIALAEIARQVGHRPSSPIVRPSRQSPVYESTLAWDMKDKGEEVFLDDLADY